jgi:hypothetical protein
MPVISVPRVLREKLSDDGVEALVELLNQAEEKAKDVIVKFSEEKYERRLAEVCCELRQEIANVRADIIRWMFIFWVGQVGALLGILLAFFKK